MSVHQLPTRPAPTRPASEATVARGIALLYGEEPSAFLLGILSSASS
jgi:hypothetical protein